AKRGYDMIGIDLSCDMLTVAREKAQAQNLNILFLEQDMTAFELYGTVDAIVCLLDSVNYIVKPEALLQTFKAVQNYLNPQGIFIFDINTSYKFRHILGQNTYTHETDDMFYVWQNDFDGEICEFALSFFVKEKAHYRRFDEVHYERSYTLTALKRLLKRAGLTFLDAFDDLTFSPPHSKSERIFLVAQKEHS
ncbi:MAG: class I SAM-dependent methyltransferase, partial [Hyphomonadaceae bacterium]|nr:class I SAM-dependent methyltransferase [Clostridia bacterium]